MGFLGVWSLYLVVEVRVVKYDLGVFLGEFCEGVEVVGGLVGWFVVGVGGFGVEVGFSGGWSGFVVLVDLGCVGWCGILVFSLD